MTKKDLVVRISRETGIIEEDVYIVIQKTLDYISEVLGKGEHVEFRNFGVFEIVTRKSRIGRNPKKPETAISIPSFQTVKFKPGKKMKSLIKK